MIDYRELLKKYIHHIIDEEGIDYINHCWTAEDGPLEGLAYRIFTQEEIDELDKMSDEYESRRDPEDAADIPSR